MTIWSGSPIDLSKYTDDELATELADVQANITTCEQYENWKRSLKAEESWIDWELKRRKEGQ